MTELIQGIIVGVDTHKHLHVAVALSLTGERLGALTIATDAAGYEQLLTWARSLGRPERFGIEGTGSYGQGLVSYLRRHNVAVLEAGRPDRRDRRTRGKTDTIDAENAARSVLAGRAGETPRRAEGTSEMIRQIKIARDIAVKARSQAIITLKTLIVTAPDDLRGELEGLSKALLRERCAGLRPGRVVNHTAACKHALRSIARHWQHLDADIKTHDKLLDELTSQAAPTLREAFGIGPDVAAEMLILAGDRPTERLRSEAAFASLCGAPFRNGCRPNRWNGLIDLFAQPENQTGGPANRVAAGRGSARSAARAAGEPRTEVVVADIPDERNPAHTLGRIFGPVTCPCRPLTIEPQGALSVRAARRQRTDPEKDRSADRAPQHRRQERRNRLYLAAKSPYHQALADGRTIASAPIR